MTRWFTILIILFSALMGVQVFAKDSEPVFRYLKSPQVKWENNRLTGKLHDVPLDDLLVELTFYENFQLVIFGDLTRKINLSLDHLTIEETIKKIRRQTNLNYIMIFDEENSSEPDKRSPIEKLLVFQKDNNLRETTPHRRIFQDQTLPPEQNPTFDKKKEEPISRPAPPSPQNEHLINQNEPPPSQMEPSPLQEELPLHQDARVKPPVPDPDQVAIGQDKAPSEKVEVEFEGDLNDLNAFVETLSNEKRISAEEYEMILKNIKNKRDNP